jgi:hypothetical protein
MPVPARLVAHLAEFDFGRERLFDRLAGPDLDSGNGTRIAVPLLTDDEYFWEPVPDCWSIRRRADGPGPGANVLYGAGEWARDSARPSHPWPPPFTTIAWRMGHLSEMLAGRADWTNGDHSLTEDQYEHQGTAAGAIAAFDSAAAAWRAALLGADDAALDTIGYSSYPDGSDPEEPFIDIVWWVNQELLHHGAEIALLRDLYRDLPR